MQKPVMMYHFCISVITDSANIVKLAWLGIKSRSINVGFNTMSQGFDPTMNQHNSIIGIMATF